MGLKIHSWNVNGLRAVLKKGFLDYLDQANPDILCLQETKLTEGTYDPETFKSRYPYQYYHCAERKGYSGTAVFSKHEPLKVSYDLPKTEHPLEGRVITAEYPDFFLVNTYTPNARAKLVRLPYRHQEWDPDYRKYLKKLQRCKPVIACGDFNVAHQEIDLARPNGNHKNPGFTDEERTRFTELLDSDLIDTYRHLNPDQTDAYTWWSYRTAARKRNIGWRIDYFLISDALLPKLQQAAIHADVLGSDHCPVSLTLRD